MSERRPPLTEADATVILARHYSLQAQNIAELVSFDSRNFAVEAVPLVSCEHSEKETQGEGADQAESTPRSPPLCQKLVLKVFNRELCTVEKLPTTRQQIVCSQFLRQQGFLCPEIVHTSKGELMARTTSDKYKWCRLLLDALIVIFEYIIDYFYRQHVDK